MKPIERIMRAAPVIPVLEIDDINTAQPIARALVEGGLTVLEVTLRTPAALDAIVAMREVEGAIVGAGTVVDEASLTAAVDAGSQFIVSPGLTRRLGEAAVATGIPFLPGVATAGDIMCGLDLGLTHFKFFPAEANGGVAVLRSLCGPFRTTHFCPTGGIRLESAADWLALDQVLCVGGSWLVPAGLPIDLPTVVRRASAANRLKR